MSADARLFLLINRGQQNTLFDWLMPHLTNAHKELWFWVIAIPLVVWSIVRGSARWRRTLILAAIVPVTANFISTDFVKNIRYRNRPTATVIVDGKSEFVVHGARLPPHSQPLGNSSFPSSHSTTTAALATVIIVRHRRRRKAVWALILLPLVIGYSRVYVGVHYPLDVLAGWCLGTVIGMAACGIASSIESRRQETPEPVEAAA